MRFVHRLPFGFLTNYDFGVLKLFKISFRSSKIFDAEIKFWVNIQDFKKKNESTNRQIFVILPEFQYLNHDFVKNANFPFEIYNNFCANFCLFYRNFFFITKKNVFRLRRLNRTFYLHCFP